MKNVENKTTTIKLQNEIVTYASLLMTVLNQPVKEGITISDMRINLRIIDAVTTAIEKNSDVISFEDTDFTKVVKLVENSTWNVNHIDILNFVDYIASLI